MSESIDTPQPVGDDLTSEPVEVSTTDAEAKPKRSSGRTKDVVSEVENSETPQVFVSPSAPPASAPHAAVGGTDRDPVKLSAIVYRNPKTRKSLSVHHLQRRLREWGYPLADMDGFYREATAKAVAEFQRDHELEVTARANRETVIALFEGDPNIELIF